MTDTNSGSDTAFVIRVRWPVFWTLYWVFAVFVVLMAEAAMFRSDRYVDTRLRADTNARIAQHFTRGLRR